MSNKKKSHTPVDGAARGTFPVAPVPHYALMLAAAKSHSSVIKQCSDYNNQQIVKDAVAELDLAILGLEGTLGSIAGLDAARLNLETQRTLDAGLLFRTVDGVETAVNKVCKGQKKSLQAYGASVGRPDLPPLGDDPPTDVRGKSTLGTNSATFQCKAETRVTCYHYQWSFDPGNPDAWPNRATEGGARHTLTGLTHGQKVYFRIAVQRPKVGIGKWSSIVEVTVQ